MKNNTVCVIDDDEIYQFLVRQQIESRKLANKILVFSDGEWAADFFKSEINNAGALPDVVLLDLNMPIMDGWEFLEEFKALKPLLPKKIAIYVVTSSINQSDINKAKNISEVCDYVVKPMTDKMLVKILADANC